MEGLFSIKSDVYSFGVLMLEIVSGKKNMGFYHPEQAENLLRKVNLFSFFNCILSSDMKLFIYCIDITKKNMKQTWRLWNEGEGLELIDQTLVDTCPGSEALRLIHIALLCVQEDPNERPTMSLVVLMLGSTSINLPRPLPPPFSVGRPIFSDQSTTSGAMIRLSASDQSSTSAST